MTDVVTPRVRSRMMSGIRSKNTRPEILVRKALYARGLRYRLHMKSLPGKPDLVFPKYRSVIQVNGCFWHGHACHLFKWPKTRKEFWEDKIRGNRRRDEKNRLALEALGWRVMTVWECALKGKTKLDFDQMVSLIETWIHQGDSFIEVTGHPDCW